MIIKNVSLLHCCRNRGVLKSTLKENLWRKISFRSIQKTATWLSIDAISIIEYADFSTILYMRELYLSGTLDNKNIAAVITAILLFITVLIRETKVQNGAWFLARVCTRLSLARVASRKAEARLKLGS